MKHKLILLFTIFCTVAHAQYLINYKKVADTYFENKDYYAASTFYKKALKLTIDSTNAIVPYAKEKKRLGNDKIIADYEDAMYKLAESSRMYREYSDAEKYYSIAATFEQAKYSKANFYYAQSLRANRKFSQAIEVFEKYIAKNPDDPYAQKAKIEIFACRFAINEMRYPRLVQLIKIAKDVNGLGSNYAPIKFQNQLFFTSSRPVSVDGKKDVIKVGETQVSTKANPYLNAIYATRNDISSTEISVKKIDFNLPKDMEFAAIAFNTRNNTAYFTAWVQGDKYAIYSSKKDGDNWSDPQPLNLQINSKDYNSMQPFVTADGKTLYYSSDRPGGYGKFDIWYASIRDDGSFGQPVNLGSNINTENDEKAPYYNSVSKRLIFSTDGRVGLGGLDFFESEGDPIHWGRPKNMGYPFNSSKDDVYFTATNLIGTEGFISSDRESSCCLEVFKVKREFISITGQLLDCKTKKPLKDADITLTDDDVVKKVKTDENGRYQFAVDARRPVSLNLEKTDYFSVSKSYSYEELAVADTLLNRDYCLIPFKVNVPIVLDNIYYEFNSAELTEASKLVLNSLVVIMEDNLDIEIELGAHTDGLGTDEYNQELSERRAKSCVDYLISKNIASTRLTSKGYGKTVPIAPNTFANGKDNPQGRAKNRRTEFKVTKK